MDRLWWPSKRAHRGCQLGQDLFQTRDHGQLHRVGRVQGRSGGIGAVAEVVGKPGSQMFDGAPQQPLRGAIGLTSTGSVNPVPTT